MGDLEGYSRFVNPQLARRRPSASVRARLRANQPIPGKILKGLGVLRSVSRGEPAWAWRDTPLKKRPACRDYVRACSLAWQREQSVRRSSSAFDPLTAWWTESCSAVPQRTQRFPSRSLAARLSFCHTERSSSGREEPDRCGRAQRTHRPREPRGKTTPQLGQRRASATSE
jgi:hypothetical protein